MAHQAMASNGMKKKQVGTFYLKKLDLYKAISLTVNDISFKGSIFENE